MNHYGLSEPARRRYALTLALVTVAGTMFVLTVLLQLDRAASAGASPPANDDLADAMALQLTASNDEAASTEGATLEAGETAPCADDIGATVWYRYTADADSTIVIRNQGTQFETALAVYRSADQTRALDGLDSIACAAGDNARIEFSLDADETVFLQVGGADGDPGELRLQFQCAGCPANVPPTPPPGATSTLGTGAGSPTRQPSAVTSTPPTGTGGTLGGVTLPDTGNGGYR